MRVHDREVRPEASHEVKEAERQRARVGPRGGRAPARPPLYRNAGHDRVFGVADQAVQQSVEQRTHRARQAHCGRAET